MSNESASDPSKWKERFATEYSELKTRTEKLGHMLANWKNLDFEPNCPYTLLLEQYTTMSRYLAILQVRAELEGIDI